MKKIFIFLKIIIMLSSFNLSPQSIINRPLSPGDRNLDPNWDWTVDNYYTLYYRPNKSITVRLPYFDNMCPIYSRLRVNNVLDIQKSDGWTLLSRDFGTPGVSDNPTFPYFILYNKFRGIIRIFVFIDSYVGNEYYAKLYFPDNYSQNQITGVFSLVDERYPYLDSLDKSYSQIFSSKNPTFPYTWVYADFNVFGYDPNTQTPEKTDLTFAYEIFLGNSSFITLNGQGSVSGLLVDYDLWASERKNPNTSQKQVDKTINNYLIASKNYIGNANTLLSNLRNFANSFPNSWWSAPILNATNFLNNFLPGAKEALGFITQLFGIVENNNTKPIIPLKWRLEETLEFKINGEIHSNSPLLHLEHTVPGVPFTKNINSTDVPLYKSPLGIFSISSQPTMEWRVVDLDSVGFNCVWDPDGQNYECEHYLIAGVTFKEKPIININPNAGIIKRSGKISILVDGKKYITDLDENIVDDFFIGKFEIGSIRIFEPYFHIEQTLYRSGIQVDTNQLTIPKFSYAYTLYYSPINRMNDTLQYTIVLPAKIIQNHLANKPRWACQIEGPQQINQIGTYSWRAKIIQGVGPYSYKWYKNGSLISTSEAINISSVSNFELTLVVNDLGNQNQSFSSSLNIKVFSENPQIEYKQNELSNSDYNEGIKHIYPNPFNPSTKIEYSLKEPSDVKIKIFNLLGELVFQSAESFQEAGNHSFVWNIQNSNNTNINSGIYILRIETNRNIFASKLMLLK